MARLGAPTPPSPHQLRHADVRLPPRMCNFDLNLTYPQTGGKLPYTPIKKRILDHRLPQSQSTRRRARSDGEDFLQELHERWLAFPEEERRRSPEERELQRREWTRDMFSAAEAVIVDANSTSALSSKSSTKSVKSTTETRKIIAKATSPAVVNKFLGVPPLNKSLRGEINAFYGCDLLDTAMIYALNFTYPWRQSPPAPLDEPQHHPCNKIWPVTTTTYSWGNAPVRTDPSPPIQNLRSSTFFMDELAANATKENVGIVWVLRQPARGIPLNSSTSLIVL
ncbi:hypothetical protein B0H14DRAFT_3174388 [Mycena olivaceomarginata]|nr:hypothetical protein B0H14DRAFT_3174388 [Mycena olivaceomarginata]